MDDRIAIQPQGGFQPGHRFRGNDQTPALVHNANELAGNGVPAADGGILVTIVLAGDVADGMGAIGGPRAALAGVDRLVAESALYSLYILTIHPRQKVTFNLIRAPFRYIHMIFVSPP